MYMYLWNLTTPDENLEAKLIFKKIVDSCKKYPIRLLTNNILA